MYREVTSKRLTRQPERHRVADPWQSDDTGKSTDQGQWLLSYLDVMTLLFAFFVMLFAYQKAQNADLIRSIHGSAGNAPEIAGDKPFNGAVSHATSQSTATAIAMMKSQSTLQTIARDVSIKPNIVPVQDKPGQLQPAINAIAQLSASVMQEAIAADQVASQLTGVLKDETSNNQVEVNRSGTQIRLEITNSIMFDAGSAALSEQGLAILNRVKPTLSKHSGVISVEGHTDDVAINTRQFPSNWELSAARASAVTRHLIKLGLPDNRLRAIGMADTSPNGTNMTSDGRARNRRVSIIINWTEAAG